VRVTALFAKPAPRAPMIAVQELRGVAGQGLVDDANAHPASPRHVLLVDANDLRELSLRGDQLRANIVLDGNVNALPSGTVLAIGELRMRITIECDRCAHLERVRAGLSKMIGARRGMLARVVESGRVRVGDSARVLAERLPAMPADWKRRAADVVASLPAGETINYRQLAITVGVDRAYIRAMPTVLRALGIAGRIVKGDAASLPAWDAQPYFADSLREERADVLGDSLRATAR
jgi:MOSC domain-containing protein YiiM